MLRLPTNSSKKNLVNSTIYATLVSMALFNCQFRDFTRMPDDQSNLVQLVDPRIGSKSDFDLSTGNTYPAVAHPWGMNFWTPQTEPTKSRWIYNYDAPTINGFRCTHMPSPWMGDYGAFSIMPGVGELIINDQKRALKYYHTSEVSLPNYYQVDFFEKKITAEMTATPRGGMMQFTFPESQSSWIILDAFPGGSYIKVIPRMQRIIGWVKNNSGGTPKNFAMYFVIDIDKPFDSFSLWNNDSLMTLQREIEGDQTGIALRFNTAKNEQIGVKIATSFISMPQSVTNLNRELTRFTFDQLKIKLYQTWNTELNKIMVEGGTAEQKEMFYSSLYRMMLFPRMFYEIDEEGNMVHYSPYNGNVRPGYLYADVGLWDVFRALFPFYTIMYPERNSDIIQGLLNAYKEGGWLPIWPSPGYRKVMIGTHSASLFADALVKGITDFDVDLAYQAVKKDAFVTPPVWAPGRDGIKEYNNIGFVPYPEYRESTSKTLEYAYDDFCILQMAKKLNQIDDIPQFTEKSYNYKHVFDPSVGFMRGRKTDGSWFEPFDPIEWGGPFTEGNAWHYSWSVFHDVKGLVNQMGGDEKFIEKLDKVFTTPSEFKVGSYGKVIHEMTEMVLANKGQYAHGNQPIQHMPYLYNYTSQPWKTQKWVRSIMDDLYKPTPDGYCGDEDNGQMSAWYVFSSMGFYPVTPGHPSYVLGSPLFRKITLRLPNGNTFIVEAPDNSEENIYVQKAELNGSRYEKNWISHEDILKGGKLTFYMDNKPEKKRGILEDSYPFSLSGSKE
ncbi:MAG: GH92 family glycosyl hydrolase [Cyclobacteriaceae bacterium]|nr:GH92 family glycosyl hydrolase [Cyclobacteriaceae bacterium]